MRQFIFLAALALGCSHNTIGPDDAGGQDSGNQDGSTPGPDGSSPDGSSPDGSVTPDGGKPKGDQGYTAGSRLKVRYYEGSDGAEQANGFYDSTLNVACTFMIASDGTLRCLPGFYPFGVANTAYPATSGYFSDSGCTNQLASYAYAGGCPVAYATAYDGTVGLSCTTAGYHVHVFNITTTKYAGTIYQKSGSTCPVVTTPPAGTDFYQVGSELPPSSFVQATETVK